MPTLNRRDLDHSIHFLTHTYRNGPADAQFQERNFGLSAKIRFADIAGHLLASTSQAENAGSIPVARSTVARSKEFVLKANG